ncbi:MAG: extracellular solute-binding protein, partial [Lachnospiraceae bacterium]
MVPDWGVPTDEQLAAFSKNTGIKVNIAEAVGWLEPLDVSNEDKDDIPTIETFTIDDKVLAMPYANDYCLSFYNTKQFEAAGITEEPQTGNQVLEDCRKLKSTGTVN